MRYSSRLWAVFPVLFVVLLIVPRGASGEPCRDLPHGEVEVLPPRVISGHPLLRTVALLAPLAGAQEVTAELSLTADAEEPDSGEALEGAEDADVEHKAGDIFRMGEPVRVEENHEISGDVVVMGSDAEVLGKVNGDVVAVGGNIVLGPTASIVGDAVSVGGSISKEPGAKVYGQEVSMGGIPIPFLTLGLRAARNPLLANALGLLWTVARMLAVVLFCVLVAVVIPRHMGIISATLREDVVKAGLIGLLIEFLTLPGIFALVISIVGIFAVPAVVLLLLVAGLAGLTASALLVGRRLLPNRPIAALAAPVALGAAAIQAPAILARLIGFIPFLFPLKLVFGILGGVVFYLAITVGLGAVWMTRFGRRIPQPKPGPQALPSSPGPGPVAPVQPPPPPPPPAPPEPSSDQP